jgi:hypothetical protein
MDCARAYRLELNFPLKTMLLVTVSSFAVVGGILLVWLSCGTLHGLIKEVLK